MIILFRMFVSIRFNFPFFTLLANIKIILASEKKLRRFPLFLFSGKVLVKQA